MNTKSRSSRKSYFVDSQIRQDLLVPSLKAISALGNAKILLTIDSKKQLDYLSAFGRDVIKTLKNKGEAVLNGIYFKLWIPDDFPMDWTDGVLAIYPTSTSLDRIDDLYRAEFILVIPWNNNEIEAWVRTWNAENLLEPDYVWRFTSELPLIVVNALHELTGINVATGLSHPLDKGAAVSMFKTLHKAGISLNADQIKGHLITAEHWPARKADEIREVVEKILKGVRVHGKDSSNEGKKALKRWENSNHKDS